MGVASHVQLMSELTTDQRRQLETFEAQNRYSVYRRRGLDPALAVAAAVAWDRNRIEQSVRRRSHGTGCT